MKRILPLLLIILLLLTACGESVPAYTAPSEELILTESTLPSEELTLTESTPPTVTPEINSPDSAELTTYPADLSAVRLEGDAARAGDAVYFLYDPLLRRYDMAEGKITVCCNKKNCPHYDENCDAYVAEDTNGIAFGIHDGKAYFVGGAQNEYGELVSLSFFSLDLTTGERKTLYTADMEGKVADFGGAMLCGNKAVLCYSLAASAAPAKQQYILSIDLTDGAAVTLLDRELVDGSVYNLWGMDEKSVIVAYHRPTAGQAYPANFSVADWNYDAYTRNLQSWVMLQHSLEGSAGQWKSFAYHDAQHELHLYDYHQFYGGKLYYVYGNRYVKVYDPATQTSEFLFEQRGITDMTCLDGRIFYETDEGAFWYELATGVTHLYLQPEERRPFFLISETDDDFLCQGYLDKYNCYRISKTDFYDGNYDAAVLLEFLL